MHKLYNKILNDKKIYNNHNNFNKVIKNKKKLMIINKISIINQIWKIKYLMIQLNNINKRIKFLTILCNN